MSPPILSICIRAGWFVGVVKENYLKCESVSDQYIGGCTSGLYQLEKRLLLHPHYFISLQLRTKLKNTGKRKDNILVGFQATKEG